jgi:hypothetical protein
MMTLLDDDCSMTMALLDDDGDVDDTARCRRYCSMSTILLDTAHCSTTLLDDDDNNVVAQ